MEKGHVILIGGNEIELRMDTALTSSALRAFVGVTPMDAEVDAMPIPVKPLWLYICILVLRSYRRIRPPCIGHRCVFDPSCSRYSELAFRRYGFIKGGLATLKRLHRCKPGIGGMDVP
jgi:putative component of membrane protein insertase Oxa1/YidC/SpoIIIJ protein YidD